MICNRRNCLNTCSLTLLCQAPSAFVSRRPVRRQLKRLMSRSRLWIYDSDHSVDEHRHLLLRICWASKTSEKTLIQAAQTEPVPWHGLSVSCHASLQPSMERSERCKHKNRGSWPLLAAAPPLEAHRQGRPAVIQLVLHPMSL